MTPTTPAPSPHPALPTHHHPRRVSRALGAAAAVAALLLGCTIEPPEAPTAEASSAVTTSFDWAVGWMGTSSSGAMSTLYQATSNGAVMTGTRLGLGHYRVTVPGLNTAASGNVLVSAYGSNAHCQVAFWSPWPAGLLIDVLCFAPGGAASDSRFVVSYVNEVRSLQFPDHVRAAYLWHSGTDSPAESQYRWSSIGGPGVPFSVTSSQPGVYHVIMTGMAAPALPPGGVAMATAYGSTPRYCQVAGWANVGGGTNRYVDVSCFDASGAPASSPFTLRYWTWGSWGAAEGGYVVDTRPELTTSSPDPAYWAIATASTTATPVVTRTATGFAVRDRKSVV